MPKDAYKPSWCFLELQTCYLSRRFDKVVFRRVVLGNFVARYFQYYRVSFNSRQALKLPPVRHKLRPMSMGVTVRVVRAPCRAAIAPPINWSLQLYYAPGRQGSIATQSILELLGF